MVFPFPIATGFEEHKIVDPALDKKTVMLFKMFEKPHEMIAERNEAFVNQEPKRFEWLFNSIEKYTLTKSQVRSIITDEYVNLVIAGAGTGKTSTIVGKAAYILKKGLAKPEEFLLLSFGRDVKQEMQKRIRSLGLNMDVRTFHGLGLNIVANVEGKMPSVSEISTDKLKRSELVQSSVTTGLGGI